MDSHEQPHDLGAERALLGALLLTPERINEVDGLAPAAMYRLAHRHILAAMQTHKRVRGAAGDMLAIHSLLEESKQDDEVGGLVYLSELLNSVPRTINLDLAAEKIQRTATTREALNALHTTTETIRTSGITEDALASLQAVFAAGGEGRVGSVAYEQAIHAAMAKERILKDARKRLEAEAHPPLLIPPTQTLSSLLGEPDEIAPGLIDKWQTRDSRVLFAAQYKAGKSTLVTNLGRSLVDGDPFLGVADVLPLKGALGVIDTELPKHLQRKWWGAQGIRNQDRVLLYPLKHYGLRNFNIMHDPTRAAWAKLLKDAGVEYLVLDCLRPMLDALGLDENSEVGPFLSAFDALLVEAGIVNAMVVDHMGHGADRPRGESRKRDWCDVEWRLTRKSDDPSSERSITAYGRDIDQPKQALAFNPVTRHLTLERPSHVPGEMTPPSRAIFDLLDGSTLPLNRTQIKDRLMPGVKRNAIDKVLDSAPHLAPWLLERPGPRGAKHYSINPTFPRSRTLPSPSREGQHNPPSDVPSAYTSAGIGKVVEMGESHEQF